jgi:hypothetical protein
VTFTELLAAMNAARLVEEANAVAQAARPALVWNNGVRAILTAAADNHGLAPNISALTQRALLQKWLQKYTDAFNHRISRRASNPPGTVSDPIVETIIGSRLEHLTPDDLSRISFGHRLSMSAENILGLLLEEYLSVALAPFGWHCCWGETLRSVDFVNEDGRLLQVKNRSNSENSSSSRVRIGTEIQKWFRVNATTGRYQWCDLNAMHHTDIFSEDHFTVFVLRTLGANPNALAVEPTNPWRE